MKRTIAFSGSRTIRDQATVEILVDGLAMAKQRGDELTIVTGGAAGLDSLVDDYVRRVHKGIIEAVTVPADWDHCGPECPQTSSHRRTRMVPADDQSVGHPEGHDDSGLVKQSYCPWAGGRRNQKILDDYRPNQLIAVVDKPLHLSKGTADMVKRAKQARIPVTLIDLTGGNP